MNHRLLLFLRLAAVSASAVVAMSTSAVSMEGGQTPALRGYRDFLSGVLPPPGVQFRYDTYLYNGAERSTIPQGQLGVKLKALAHIFGATVVTPYRVLGGNYAFGIRAALSDVSVEQMISRPRITVARNGGLQALSDIVLSPVILGWHSGPLHWNVSASAWVPAGNYDKTRIANTGRNYWSVAPQFGFTYFDPKTGWEISAAGLYVVSFENTETKYRSGNVAQIDFAVGKILLPQLKLGIVGYLVQQVTADSGPGAILGERKLRVAGLGPAATFTFVVNNVAVNLVAKYYREFSAQNTTQGDAANLSFRVKF